MDLTEDEIKKLATIAFNKIQLPPYFTNKAGISHILKDDPWWRSLDARAHQEIGKYIKNHFEILSNEYPDGIYYELMHNTGGRGIYYHNLENYEEEKREYVYHYTDLSAFLGILSGKMRLSNSKIMNDKKESIYYLERLFDEINKEVKKAGKTIPDNFINEYNALKDIPSYFISFTLYEDDAAQWERYGNEGAGICIVFDKIFLQKISNKRGIKFDFVNYYQDYHKLPEVNEVVNYINSNSNISVTRFSSEKMLLDYLVSQSILYKHPSFRSEYEYRMYYATNNYKLLPPSRKREETSDGRIREFYEFNWYSSKDDVSTEASKLIPKIILGPRSKLNKDILFRRLNDVQSTWKGEIIESDCPLR